MFSVWLISVLTLTVVLLIVALLAPRDHAEDVPGAGGKARPASPGSRDQAPKAA